MSGKFTVNPASGEIVNTLRLDREIEDRYVLTVVAADSGTIPKSSSTLVTVLVEDVNDHSPRFDKTLYTGLINDPTNIGELHRKICKFSQKSALFL